MKNKLSIVMPSFNQVGFIEIAIRSVFDQRSIGNDLELIVMDGGSSDGTCDVLNRLSLEFHDDLLWFSENDSGPSEAINKALAMVKGDIIGWLNSDDAYCECSFETVLDYFSDNPAVLMIYGEGIHIDEYGRFIKYYPTEPFLTLDSFNAGSPLCQPTVFFRRQVLSIFGDLDESLSTAFDYDLWLRVFKKHPAKVKYINSIIACSRLHDATLTRKERRVVAIEGVFVTYRHLGVAQPHWILSYFNEFCSSFPSGNGYINLQEHMFDVIRAVSPALLHSDVGFLQRKIKDDVRWKLSVIGLGMDIYDDGWIAPNSMIRVSNYSALPSFLVLHVDFKFFSVMNFKVKLVADWLKAPHISTFFYQKLFFRRKSNGCFSLRIPLPQASFFEGLRVCQAKLECSDFFIPSLNDDSSADDRKLSLIVKDVSWE